MANTTVKKTTKVEYFSMIKDVLNGAEITDAQKSDIMDFIDKQVEQIENKAVKAKERAAKKKAEGDELYGAVKAVLTGELQSANDILDQIDMGEDEEITVAKVRARLTKLVNDGTAEKEQVKTEDKKKVMCYRLVGVEVVGTDND